MRRARVRSLSLTTKFALLSAVAMLVLGVTLHVTLRRVIERRAHEDAVMVAEQLARVAVEPHLTPAELRRGLEPSTVALLDSLVKGSGDRGVHRLKIFDAAFTVIYSDARELVGRRTGGSPHLRAALAGRTGSKLATTDNSEHATERPMGTLLEAFVPLRPGGTGGPAGVAEFYLPYAPVERAIAADTRMLVAVLLGGLSLLYLVLFRVVRGASRRLREHAARSEHMAVHDALTGLPNRTLLFDRVDRAVRTARRENWSVGVILLDLDRFKEVNDTLGHHSGDILLQEVGRRLLRCLRESDTVARLGGDEFAVLLPKIADEADARVVARKIVESLEAPFIVQGLELAVEASVGIAVGPRDGGQVEELMQRADVAMYVAKRGHTGIETYAAEHDQYDPARLSLLAELRRAVEEGELTLHYQPKVAVAENHVVGVEALVRWQHPTRGLVPPNEFVPLAERTGLVRPLLLYVLDHALADLRRWHDQGLTMTVAVNLSSRNLLDVQLPSQVAELLARHGVAPEWLELELTETAVMEDPTRAREVLDKLHAMGVRLSIDDFGTGYTSMAYLERLPVTELKIDRYFVHGMEADEGRAMIVRAIIDLGKTLGLTVVAEGVETSEVLADLSDLGCDVVQGYLLSRPTPAENVPAVLSQALQALERREVPAGR